MLSFTENNNNYFYQFCFPTTVIASSGCNIDIYNKQGGLSLKLLLLNLNVAALTFAF